jgi:hypothetical protein
MRMRTTILVAAATAAVLAGGVAPATAVSERSAPAGAVAGRVLAAPRPEALVTRLPVRVVVRVPARTSRLRVRVGGRNVTARFRRTGGSLRAAKLSRRDGLRYGPIVSSSWPSAAAVGQWWRRARSSSPTTTPISCAYGSAPGP